MAGMPYHRHCGRPKMQDFINVRRQFSIWRSQIENCLAETAHAVLREWDRNVRHSSAGALIFEAFVIEWVKALLEDDLGEDLALYLAAWPSTYSIEDVILDHPGSRLWDRVDTAEREGPAEILEMALVRTMTGLQKRFGSDLSRWSWGRLHRITFRHPAGGSPFLSGLLNRGPYPAEGSLETLNVAGFRPGGVEFDVAGIPTMRMVVPLGDLDGTRVVSPPGQSGIPSHPHYDDMIEPWREGRSVPLPFSRQSVNEAAVSTLWLRPGT